MPQTAAICKSASGVTRFSARDAIECREMSGPIPNPEPNENAPIIRRMYHLVFYAVLVFSVLIAALLASFAGIVPKWVANASSSATLPAAVILIGRTESLRRRLHPPRAN